jgi:hypothetical protein
MTDYSKLTDRELDALVAEEVFGCSVEFEATNLWPVCKSESETFALPDYSTSIEEAWEVVEAVRALDDEPYGNYITVETVQGCDKYACIIGNEEYRLCVHILEDTPERAICIAALNFIEHYKRTQNA